MMFFFSLKHLMSDPCTFLLNFRAKSCLLSNVVNTSKSILSIVQIVLNIAEILLNGH